MNLSYEELEALVAVVEEESFRSAAKKIHKSQSSISYSIANLEKKLGTQIFYRASQRIALTSAGKIIYNKALSVMKINQEIFSFAQIIAHGIEIKINLVITAVTPTPILMQILKEFNERFPQTQIELRYTSHEEPIELLSSQEADLVVSSGKVYTDGFDRIKWQSIEFMAVTSPDHPASLSGITEEDLYSLTYLVVGGRKTLAPKVSEKILETANIWHITDFLIKKELLTSGLGWGFMPKMLIQRELDEGILVAVPAKNLLLKQLDVVRNKSEFIGPGASFLWNLFAKYSNYQLNQSLAEELIENCSVKEFKQEW